MAIDLVIRGGTVVDGSGGVPFFADVAVEDGRIAAIGRVNAAADKTIDASGAIVTPGFIDAHTHYDGQAIWDSQLRPSVQHGVTTAMMGNCGVGFAPLRPGQHDVLIRLMEGVEDIPGTALSEGLDWRWDSFADYLDRLDATARTINVATQMPHDPLRLYVMGERAIAREAATSDDIARMRDLVREALLAGAWAFSTGRTDGHRMADGSDTPASIAAPDELTGIASVLRDLPYRTLMAVSDFDMALGPSASMPSSTCSKRWRRPPGARSRCRGCNAWALENSGRRSPGAPRQRRNEASRCACNARRAASAR